jgi:hypothetical protein
VEYRRYLLHPGRRDELIELFEREFVESQEQLGMCLLGLFREERDDDRFVWWRGFRNMEERPVALAAFYGGPVWKRHSAAANATMVAVDDVLLLRPTFIDETGLGGGRVVGGARPPVAVTIADVSGVSGDRGTVGAPASLPPGFRLLARFETLHAENNFPRLPVRDADVVVIAGVGDDVVDAAVPTDCYRLRPTARSRWP